MSQSPLIDQLQREERQRLEREFHVRYQAALLGGVIGGALVSLHTPSWIWVAGVFVLASALWRWRGIRVSSVIIGRRLRKNGGWSRETLVNAASSLAYTTHQSAVNEHGSRYIDHASRVANAVAGDARAEAVAWLHAVLDHCPEAAHEVSAFPHDVATAVHLLTHRTTPSPERYQAGIESSPLASKVYLASEKIVFERKEHARRNRARAAEHELSLPRTASVEVYEEAA